LDPADGLPGSAPTAPEYLEVVISDTLSAMQWLASPVPALAQASVA
jgi:hypothetical protein